MAIVFYQSTCLEGIWKRVTIGTFLQNDLKIGPELSQLSFHYSHIRQNSPAWWRPCFFRPINMAWRNLIGGHLRNISASANRFGRKRIFVSLPWKPEFCMDPKKWKKFWWGHWEDAFCEVSPQLTHWLLKRCWRTTDDAKRTTDAG